MAVTKSIMRSSDIKARIASARIIPIVRTTDRSEALAVIRTLAESGFECIEVTLTIPSAPALIAELNAEFSGRILFGAGTVLTAEVAKQCIDAGAVFIVSPITVPDAIELAKQADVLTMAGALTPNEIFAASELGADLVKVFPVSAVGGASYIRSVKAVFPDIDLVPTGGISLDNAEMFLKYGSYAVGIGSELTRSELVLSRNTSELKTLARKFDPNLGVGSNSGIRS
jgi:2-dehydro-3-deoxyphosphogluconate aldolase/(4S)-4-hydroxy-2-oxoglutarate aldolase